jgi:serine/threonine protein kinase
MTDYSGKLIGRYQISNSIGVGGMASVYRGRDQRLQRDVAVKFIRTEMFPPAQLHMVLQRFEREAVALARLDHPNIVQVYDIGEYDGTPYVVMEFLSGGTLRQRLNGCMPYQQAAALLAPVARALEYAHAEGIIHRDVKPSNIIMTRHGIPKLSDFGIAKLLMVEEGAHLTGTGMSMGTPAYMAPEQWSGKNTPAVDIYAMGAVFFEMLSGQLPFQGDTPAELFVKVMTQPLPDLDQVLSGSPQPVLDFLRCALAKNPADRFSSMAQMAAALEMLRGEASNSTHLRAAAVTLTAVDMPTPPSHPVLDLQTCYDAPVHQPVQLTHLHPAAAPFQARKKLPVSLLIGGVALLLLIAAGLLINQVVAPVGSQPATTTATDSSTLAVTTETPAPVAGVTTQPEISTAVPSQTPPSSITQAESQSTSTGEVWLPTATRTPANRITMVANPTATKGIKLVIGPTYTPTKAGIIILRPTSTATAKPK